MSDISLYSSLYEPIREHAELVDDVLTKVKEGTSSPDDASCQKLGKFLINISDDQWDELPSRLVALMLREKAGFAQKNWAKIGKALMRSERNDQVIEALEHLAKSLQYKHAETVARMGVWSR